MFADMLAIAIRMAALPLGVTMNPAGGFCEKYEKLSVSCQFSDGTMIHLVNSDGQAGFYFGDQLMMICDAEHRTERIWNCEEI